MYIKEIKLNSFKSFADKVNIELNPTFTGIVGPNGSGKSNIVDAVKWVLGEQSLKTLRGSSGMSDVIFSGSKSRNASNHASVSITFDNTDKMLPSDFNEITIKRTVSRSGENEYFLNNEKCRLKDISDLLVDSFSSKESFNIIPQNKVEEILSDKSESRRIIFEEAAGVLKYKRRKEETLRKLSRTHENIERLDVILGELKEQVEPLKIASRKAIEYKESKDKLESLDIALIIKDITQFNELLTSKNEEKERLTLELTSSSNEYTKKSTEIEKLKLKNVELEELLLNKRNEFLASKEQLTELLSKKELAIERSKYDKDSSDVKNKLVNLKEKELKLNNEFDLKTKENENLKILLEEKEKEFNILLTENSTHSNELNSKRNEYSSLKRKELETKSKIDILTAAFESMSKVPYAVKAVLDNPSLKGINNIIANIVNTKKEYGIMLEIALGSSSNFIIVDDEESAKGAINYLKSNNRGRATFFPLSVIKPKSIDPDIMKTIKNATGFVGIASDLVNYDNKYYNIVMNQLGNIIVVDNITNAVYLSKKINYRYRIVTLDGELLHVGGSLSGGSFKQNNSYISDKYEIDRLKVSLETVQNNIKTLEEKIFSLEKSNVTIEQKNMNFNLDIIRLKEQINSKQEMLKSIKEELNKVKNEINDLSTESDTMIIDEIMQEYYNVESICNKLETEINFNSIEKRKVLDEINDIEREIKKSNGFNNESTSKINTIEIETVKLNMALDNLLNRLNEEYSLTYEGAKGKYLLEIDEKEARKIVTELKRVIKVIGNVNMDSIEEYERVNKRYTFLNKQKEDLESSENDLLEIISSMDKVMIDKFESTFNKINKEFSKVFINLFGGGEAYLKLTDPSNILETGIEIIAIPPGKNMKSLSLLSGGEKTLTAISLLFSIMNLKKVPFAILDEVESALDDVNAERFGEYLSNYKDKTQLLIITHKKKTMEYVDLLYGVTMQESGVSKLVSVKLESIN